MAFDHLETIYKDTISKEGEKSLKAKVFSIFLDQPRLVGSGERMRPVNLEDNADRIDFLKPIETAVNTLREGMDNESGHSQEREKEINGYFSEAYNLLIKK